MMPDATGCQNKSLPPPEGRDEIITGDMISVPKIPNVGNLPENGGNHHDHTSFYRKCSLPGLRGLPQCIH